MTCYDGNDEMMMIPRTQLPAFSFKVDHLEKVEEVFGNAELGRVVAVLELIAKGESQRAPRQD